MYKKSKKSLIQLIFAGSLMFYVFSGITSVLNYAFYPIIARFVSVSDYGQIQFLVSMFTQLAVGFVVLNILAIIIGAELTNKNEQKQAIHGLNVVSSFVTIVIALIGVSVLLIQKGALGLSSSTAIIALGLSLLASVPFTIAIGQLQGNSRFVVSGVLSMIAALFKLIFSILFVALGFGVAGAISGILVGVTLSLVVVEIIKHHKNQKTPQALNFAAGSHISNLSFIRKRAIVALLAITVITILSAADSITSRLVLGTVSAGHYAAVATVAKMILAATSPLMWLALPPSIEHNGRLVLKYTVVALAIATAFAAIFILAPEFFTQTIVGVNAKQYITLLPLSCISMVLCSIAFILLTVSVCAGKLKNVMITTSIAVIVFFGTLLLVSSTAGQLIASIYGQLTASAVFIVGGLIGLRKLLDITETF